MWVSSQKELRMKTWMTILSASVLLTTAAFAETPLKAKEQVKVQNENTNRFKSMSTDELLQQRGTLRSEQEREQLHNELMNREKTMTKEQKEKFSRVPEKVSQEMGQQGKGMGYGQGQGDVQGLHKGVTQGQHKGQGKGGR